MDDDSQLWHVERINAADIYGRGVKPGGPWLAVFGSEPVDPETLGRLIPDPLEDED